MTKKFTCPARDDAPELRDKWEALLTGEFSCSYCGSLPPARFMELARQGWYLIPTDNAHKVYLGPPLPDETKARLKKLWREKWRAVAFTACREDDSRPTAQEVEDKLEHLWDAHGAAQAWTPARHYSFYFAHLSVEQQHEFVAMYNENKLNVGHPGHFYVPPYFCVEETATSAIRLAR